MSVFGDFQRVWVKRFPERALPADWEEDVLANLAKHKQKVAILREELEKEEFYVEYLETLLSDVERHKARAHGYASDSSTPTICDDEDTDLEDKLSEENQISSSKSSEVRNDESSSTLIEDEVKLRKKKASHSVAERNTVNQCINELSSQLSDLGRIRRTNSEITERKTDGDGGDTDNVLPDSTITSLPKRGSKSGGDFITVIEVNGQKGADGAKPNEVSQQQATESDPKSKPNVPFPKKKVPPKPPPKSVSKRSSTLQDTASDDSPTSSLGRKIDDENNQSDDEARADGLTNVNHETGSKRSNDSDNSLEKKRKNSLSKTRVESESSSLGGKNTGSESSWTSRKLIDSETSSSSTSGNESATLSIGKVKHENRLKLTESGSRESIASISSSHDLPSITDRVKSFESVHSYGSEHKNKSGNCGTQDSFESITADDIQEEPYYDSVPNDLSDGGEYVYIQAGGANIGERSRRNGQAAPSAPRAPPDSPTPSNASNYVNIHFLLHQGEALNDQTEVETAPVSAILRQDSTNSNVEPDNMTMHRYIVTNIIESETLYLECLYIMEKYMNAIKASLNSSQPVISEEEYNTIFYKIPELHELHKSFLEGLKSSITDGEEPFSVGQHFKKMAENINIYGAFLHNYSRATDAVRKRSSSSTIFSDLTRHMKLRGQPVSLDDLLHKPVARVQKNALVLHDLIKNTPTNHPDHAVLNDALNLTRNFLDEFNIIQTKSMFPSVDRAQRRLVKNSFIVELADGHRKLRHLFLFNDVIACAKYKQQTGRDKVTLELKWHLGVCEVNASEESNMVHHGSSSALLALRSQACTLRDQILLEEREDDKKLKMSARSERQRKKLAELEGQLVLASPNLPFRIYSKSNPSRSHTFFLSSEYERTQWIDSIQALQSSCVPPSGGNALSPLELQSWVTACREFLQPELAGVLLRAPKDEQLLLGDLHLHLGSLQAPLDIAADYYIVVEVDSYGHYFRKARSKLVCNSSQPRWNESFVVELEGSQNLRLLLYEDATRPILRGKCTLKLCRSWSVEVCRNVVLGNATLSIRLRVLPPDHSLRRVPTSKAGTVFGAKLQQVCKREKRVVPFVVSASTREVERRGLAEVGLYRVSGSASDLARLRKSFESNAYEAEQLLKEVDIHSVTGVLKMYLRELPEALIPEALQVEMQAGLPLSRALAHLSEPARACIDLLLDHLLKVNSRETENKMSLNNLATVFGPTLLRPTGSLSKTRQDMLASSTVDAMAQASLLYTMLQHRLRAKQVASITAND